MKKTEQPTEYMYLDSSLVANIISKMPCDEALCDMAALFKIFGDSTRIKILSLLFENELCVCDIATVLKMTQSAISHQLKILKTAKLVKSKKDGKTVFYSLADSHVHTIIAQGNEHLEE